MMSKISYAPWFFVAGVICSAVVADAGLGAYIVILFDIIPLTEGHILKFCHYQCRKCRNGACNNCAGQPAIMTTLATEIAASTGWPIKTVFGRNR